MKKIGLLVIAAVLAQGAAAQNSRGADTTISKDVNDDCKKMHVKLSYSINGRSLKKFDQTYNVVGMSKAEKESIVNRVMDSLGIPNPVTVPPPPTPLPPQPPRKKRYA